MSDPSGFLPHGMCFLWRPDMLALHVVADALIAFAYFSIPALLTWFVRRRPDVPFPPVFWMFSTFIVSCGVTHLLSIYVIWHPVYWFEGIVKALTAAASIVTAIALVPLVPKALALRSPRDLDRLNLALAATLAERETLLRRYEREHYIATTFQDASLTTIPASIGPFELSALYRPGTGDLEIGGDWYDAFRMADGRLVISIGDVTGKGLRASVIMSKMRQALRVAAQIHVPPGVMLDAADRALREEYPDEIVTAFVAVIDDVDGEIAYANAGHPRPRVRLPDGSTIEIAGGGLPLGLRLREEANETHVIPLVRGSLLVLFTDGLTESTRDYADGESRFADVLMRQAVALAPDPAAEIGAAVLGADVRDDVAILTLRVGSADDAGRRWTFDASDRAAAYRARAAIVDVLRGGDATDEEIFNAEMVFSELIGNILRHAGTAADVRIDWDEGAPVLHVLDEGGGFRYVPRLPSDVLAESGRGLFLVTELVDEFTSLHRAQGGSHARAVLRVGRRQRRSSASELSHQH